MTIDGNMDHMNFAAKPVTAVPKKAAAKKNAFFSDSDEDSDQDTKPQAAVSKPAPVVEAPKPKPPPQPQVPDTRHMWGDGQWYPDAQGAYFYYDESGQQNYYQGEYD